MLVELFLTTLSMAASYQPANHCVPVPKSSVCNPWAGNGKLFIDGKKLAEIYGVKNESIDAASWEVLMASATQGGQKQAAFWNGLFYCPTYQGQLLQYSASYTCLTDIFVYSEACNREVKSATPFCPEICENFGVSLNKLISGKEYCPTDNLPADKAEQIKWRRQLASQTSKLCQATLKKPYFEQTEQCVGGVLADQKSCGFSGNYTITKMFCDSYPSATCCTSVPTARTSQTKSFQDDFMDGVQRFSAMWGASSKVNSNSKATPFFQSIAFMVIIAVAVLAISAFTVFGIYRYYNGAKPSKEGFVSISTPKDTVAAPLVESGKNGQLKCIVKYDYSPNLSDELELKTGDMVIFTNLADDGWGDCENVTSGLTGKACTRFCETLPQ